MRRATYRLKLPITNERALRHALWLILGVELPDVQVCEDHSTPWRAFADAYFGRGEAAVWKGSRGLAGKSYMLGALAMMEALTLGVEVALLGGSKEQSTNVHKYIAEWTARPSFPRQRLKGDSTATQTRFVPRGEVRALAASQRAVRGPHPARLRLDEVDEIPLPILDAATGQPMEGQDLADRLVPAHTIFSSTHQYAEGTMTEVLRRAARKGWPVHEWCYRETMEPHGWLTRRQVEASRATMTEEMWRTEVELGEPNPGSRAITPAAVARMFDPSLGEYQAHPGHELVFEPPERGATYATGVDWAKERDWTVVKTYRTDVTPARLVAFVFVNREPWPSMVERANRRWRAYGGAFAHDATGIGNVVADYLEVPGAVPLLYQGKARVDLLTAYTLAVEHGELVAPRVEPAYTEHRLASREDFYGAGHLPDTISAGAAAWRAITEGEVLLLG